MRSPKTILGAVLLTVLLGAASARQPPGLLYTCIEAKGAPNLSSDASICTNRARPLENAASSPAERAQATRLAWLKRYPNEAAHDASRQAALEASRAGTVPERQESEAARINKFYDAQRERLRPLWNPPAP
jgi:hypothetical protein